jgi:hypothetical protein
MINDTKQLLGVLTEAQVAVLRHMLASYPLSRLIDTAVRSNRVQRATAQANPLLRHGEKFFSQNDEDGLLLEICRRINLTKGHFLEFGVGNGLENNTLILLMSGWSGAWAGAETLAYEIPPGSTRLCFEKAWITAEEAFPLYERLAKRLGANAFELLSIDLDGIDLHILAALLEHGVRPSIVVVEYNGKFPPPIRFQIDYDPSHRFEENDYYGASLQSFVDILEPAGYRLVGCNITGLNAFFVDRRFASLFTDVPTRIEDLFLPPDYATVTRIGHPPSPRTILSFLKE